MKTIVLAYHNIGYAGIKTLLSNGYDIKAIFTHKDDPNENIWFDSVAELAAANNIPVYAPEDINHPLWVERIRDLGPDILFSFYYRDMVGKDILGIPPQGCLNLHGSLLPRYRGRCPVNWVLINGEKETGVTLHYMTPKPDDGDIVGQRPVLITNNDNAMSLFTKLTTVTAELLAELLPMIKEKCAPRNPQDNSRATYYGGRRPEDGEIDWRQDASTVRNLVRACNKAIPRGIFISWKSQMFFLAGQRALNITE